MVWPGLLDTQLALVLPIARALLLQRGPGLIPTEAQFGLWDGVSSPP